MDVWEKSPFPPPERPGSDGVDGGDGPHHPDAPETPDDDGMRWWSRRIASVPAWLLLILVVVIGGGVISALLATLGSGDSTDDADGVAVVTAEPVTTGTDAPDPTSVPTEPGRTTPSAAPTTDVATTVAATTPATSPPSTAAAPTTTPTATSQATTSTTTPTTTEPATTTTTATTTATTLPATTLPATTAPATASAAIVVSEPVTTVGPNGETVVVTPRIDECPYGPECFVVAFTIDGFATRPTEWVCEFASGERYVFRFDGTDVDPACSSLDVPDSIVIEVGGLRTDPVTVGPAG